MGRDLWMNILVKQSIVFNGGIPRVKVEPAGTDTPSYYRTSQILK
jgi:hypothetical protein